MAGRFRGLGGPGGALKLTKKVEGFAPPPLWMVLKHPGTAQTPKTTDFQPNPKPPSPKPPLWQPPIHVKILLAWPRRGGPASTEVLSWSGAPKTPEHEIQKSRDALHMTRYKTVHQNTQRPPRHKNPGPRRPHRTKHGDFGVNYWNLNLATGMSN